jgi:hypothetical protein
VLVAAEFAVDFAVLLCFLSVFWVPAIVVTLFGASNTGLLVSFAVALIFEFAPFGFIAFVHPHPDSITAQSPHWRQGGPVRHGFGDVLGINYYQHPPVLPVPARVTNRPRRLTPRRNDRCPCGSGEKFKFCHGRPGWRHYIWVLLGSGVRRIYGRRARRGKARGG